MRTRNRSIRSRIIVLVSMPLIALLALWIFATSLTVGPALHLLSARTLLNTVVTPGKVLVGELQEERRASVEYLSTAATRAPAALTTQRAATDRAAADFRRAATGDRAQDAASGTLRERIRQIVTDLDALPVDRTRIDRREGDVIGAQGLYNAIMDTGYQMIAATATFGDTGIDGDVRALAVVGRGQEHLSRADAMLAAANTTGRFSQGVRDELIQSLGTARFLLAEGVGDLPGTDRTAYRTLSSSEAFTRLRGMQATLISDARAGEASPVPAGTWQPAYDSAAQQLGAFEGTAAASLADRATPVAVAVLIRLGGAGLLGLIALVLSVIVSVRVGRSLVGRLVRLRGEALETAVERLPAVVRRLHRGETVDVEVETPPLEYGEDEIGQVGHAFTEVQRTAVQSAVEEANVRRRINEVFLNIARRSQTLLHRQLALLDRMERRETGPDELEDLYRVDHLATRMRRHAEDLVILAGAAPGRGWRHPVPLIDVIRGAISEVEHYQRVDIRDVQPCAVLGRAVGDVIHLLAELLENAASFSPPQTRVEVAGQVLPDGYAVEIEDRGLGMSQEAVDAANRKLLEPPDFDPQDSARLGLFVVAQLAARHGIRVTLRPSVFGGVTAIVLIPGELVTAADDPVAPLAGEKSRDRPLLGTGGPARHSLAALQWQGTGELRTVPVEGRPVTREGTATPGSGVRAVQDRAVPAAPVSGGPVPVDGSAQVPVGATARGSVADGVTPDGLVQRRRTIPRRPMAVPQGPPGPGGRDAIPAVTEDGLPRRVRQASLAPQLRGPVRDEPAGTAPLRSPEQVRTIMSALQRGTTRGRLVAAGIDPDAAGALAPDAVPPGHQPGDREVETTVLLDRRDTEAATTRSGEAATVSLPVVRDGPAPVRAVDLAGADSNRTRGRRGAGPSVRDERGDARDQQVTGPKKDA